MSCARVSVCRAAVLATYKGPPVRVEAFARDVEGLIFAEQATVV
jgi:hypothetical protein